MEKKGVQWVQVFCLIGWLILGLSASSWGAGNLFEAVREDNLASVNSFIAAKADVNARDGNDMTALIYASSWGNIEVVRALLADNADVNAKGKYGFTALMFASKNGHAEAVQALLAAKADVNAKNNFDFSALMYASENSHAKVVRALLAAKADVNARNKYGRTALMYASKEGKVEVVRALLAAKPNVNAMDQNGVTTLMYARPNVEIMNLLKQAGAKEVEIRYDPRIEAIREHWDEIKAGMTFEQVNNLLGIGRGSGLVQETTRGLFSGSGYLGSGTYRDNYCYLQFNQSGKLEYWSLNPTICERIRSGCLTTPEWMNFNRR